MNDKESRGIEEVTPFPSSPHAVCLCSSEDEDAWLVERRKLVTASESAYLMGLSSWGDEQKVLEGKLGERTFFGNEHTAAGHFWEPRILEYLSAMTGLELASSPFLYRSNRFPWMGATPDAMVVKDHAPVPPSPLLSAWLTVIDGADLLEGDDAVQRLREAAVPGRTLLEVKNQPSKRRSKWCKPFACPKDHECQAQHQLVVMGAKVNLLVAAVDRNELYVHVLREDEMFQELLVDVCREFWEKHLRDV